MDKTLINNIEKYLNINNNNNDNIISYFYLILYRYLNDNFNADLNNDNDLSVLNNINNIIEEKKNEINLIENKVNESVKSIKSNMSGFININLKNIKENDSTEYLF